MKERLDVLLVKRNLISSRKQAKEYIESGYVSVKGMKPIKKAGTMVSEEAEIVLTKEPISYVGRGALKILGAIKEFSIHLQDKVCLDIGASTGGFTECMLEHGANKVFAIDVGHDQLAKKLRLDDRVIAMEGTNVRYLKAEDLGEKADFAAIDVSFISLTKVLEPVRDLLKDEASICCLIKPQFEAGKNRIGKGGIVRDLAVHKDIMNEMLLYVMAIGLMPVKLMFSPIKGQDGNIEYLLYLKKNAGGKTE